MVGEFSTVAYDVRAPGSPDYGRREETHASRARKLCHTGRFVLRLHQQRKYPTATLTLAVRATPRRLETHVKTESKLGNAAS